MENWLDSECWNKDDGCCKDPECQHAVKSDPVGRWFITIGHAGFNSKANNFQGYVSKHTARNAVKRYSKK